MGQLDPAFFRPFVDGTLNMMKVTCGTEATILKPFIKGTVPQEAFEIAGVLGLHCPGFNGTVTICFPEKVYLLLMSKMLGEKFETLTDDLQDGAGEFMNMIYGQAKVALNQKGHSLDRAFPTVIRGNNLQTRHTSGSKVVVVPFATEAGNLYIEICAE